MRVTYVGEQLVTVFMVTRAHDEVILSPSTAFRNSSSYVIMSRDSNRVWLEVCRIGGLDFDINNTNNFIGSLM